MDGGLLIEQVSSFPQLYVKSDPRYKNVRMSENAWKTIAVIVQETPEACEHRWKLLRNKYTALKRDYKNTPSGSGASEVTWPYFEVMRFLDPYLLTRKSYSNLSVKRKPEATEWDSSMSTIFEEDLFQESQDFETENSPARRVESEASTSCQTPTQNTQKSYTTPGKSSQGSQSSQSSSNNNRKIILSANIPRHTIPAKKSQPDILADKLTGCFEAFQKAVDNTSNQSEQTEDDHFVKSLVQDMKVFSPRERIVIKKEIYCVLVKHLEDSD